MRGTSVMIEPIELLEPRTLLAASVVRIMPLGDSITEAFAPNESYRYWLWHDLQNAGFKRINFVGSQHRVFNGSPAIGCRDPRRGGTRPPSSRPALPSPMTRGSARTCSSAT